MDYDKIVKAILLIIVILFFSYLNSKKATTQEGFTVEDVRESFNKNKRNLRYAINDYKKKGQNTIEKFTKKFHDKF